MFSAASLSENVIRSDTFHEIIRTIPQRFAVGSAGATRTVSTVQARPQRTLINPFKPNEIPCNWTCNRQRWSHVFPKGPSGEVLHQHYEKLSPAESETRVKPEKVRILLHLTTKFCLKIKIFLFNQMDHVLFSSHAMSKKQPLQS